VRGALAALRKAGGRAGDARAASGRRIASQATIQLAVRVLNVGLGVVAVALLARTLGTADFGVWSTALAYVGVFAFLNDFGFPQVGIQRMAAEPEREAEWLGALAALRTLGALAALMLCLAGIPLFLDPQGDVRVLALIFSVTVFAAAPQAFLAVFTSRLRTGITMLMLSLQGVAWTGTVVAIVATGGGLLEFAWGFVAVAVVVGAVQIAVTQHLAAIALRAGRELWGPLFRVALPLGLAGVMVTVYYRIDAVLVFNISGAREAGYYGAAYRVMDPLHVVPTAVMTSIFPVVAALHATDRERVARLVQSGLDFLVIVSLPIFVGSIAVAEPLMTAIFGDRFEPAAEVLPILLFAFVWVALGYLPGYLIPVVHLQWWFAGLALAGVAINIGLNLVLIPPHGAVGAAVATVLTEMFIAVVGTAFVLRRLRTSLSYGRSARAVLAAAVMGVAAFFAADAGLVVALLVAPPVYLGALIALRVLTIAEIRSRLAREASS
jgi:O-antigen/teichoic acid export membrane protein